MHGKRPEHPEVFKARMQHHKDLKKHAPLEPIPEKPTGDGSKVKGEGVKAEAKDAVQDRASTTKRQATFHRKEKLAEKADEKKPARGVLTHLLPNQ